MSLLKKDVLVKGLGLVFGILILLAVLTSGLVYGAARSAHREHWRYVSTIPTLDQLQNPVGRGLSLVRTHQVQTAYDVFPTHAVLFTLEKINIIVPEAVIAADFPVTLKVMTVGEQGAAVREITEWQIASDSLRTGEWVTIFESVTEYISPEETLVVMVSSDQNMDFQIGYEVTVNIYDPDSPLLKLFLPFILR